MKTLKVFIGLNGRWVLCERFPNDEDHAGLHEMLDDLVDDNIELEQPMGFYKMHFIINRPIEFNPLAATDAYLDIDKVVRIPKHG